jgi:hypothetical protein
MTHAMKKTPVRKKTPQQKKPRTSDNLTAVNQRKKQSSEVKNKRPDGEG